MKRTIGMIALAVCLAVGATGCSAFGITFGDSTVVTPSVNATPAPGQLQQPPATQQPAQPSQSQSFASGVSTIDPHGSCSVSGDLKGQFDESQMSNYLQCIVPLVDTWIDVTYSNMVHPTSYVYVSNGAKQPTGCTTTDNNGKQVTYYASDMSFEYCAGDNSVYMGQSDTWEFYQYGPTVPEFALGHEVTHEFQQEQGVSAYEDDNDTQNATAVIEHQADCGGGAFMVYLSQQGVVSEQQVIDEFGDVIYNSDDLASESGTNDDGSADPHGSKADRIDDFNKGWTSSYNPALFSCNSYVPAKSLISD